MTGATGRLGSALLTNLAHDARWTPVPWSRADFDLDRPATADGALKRDQPDVVVHCAAWTDVDGCAREPDLAIQRNGVATGRLAEACAGSSAKLVVISTNEVFDGNKTDGAGYVPTDATSPGNAYGRSKLLGEELAVSAFGGQQNLWTVRTSWLFGPPGRDFPTKIIDAGRKAADERRPMQLVADEFGSPTLAADLAGAILELLRDETSQGLYHVVNPGVASRAEWARLVLQSGGVGVETEEVPLATWPRPSTPPRWGVLEPTPIPRIGRLRPWIAAVAQDMTDRFRPNRAAEGHG